MGISEAEPVQRLTTRIALIAVALVIAAVAGLAWLSFSQPSKPVALASTASAPLVSDRGPTSPPRSKRYYCSEEQDKLALSKMSGTNLAASASYDDLYVVSLFNPSEQTLRIFYQNSSREIETFILRFPKRDIMLHPRTSLAYSEKLLVVRSKEVSELERQGPSSTEVCFKASKEEQQTAGMMEARSEASMARL